MRIKNIFNKQNAEKPKNDVSDNSDTDAENPDFGNEEMEEITETESEINDTTKSDEETVLEEITETDDEESDKDPVAIQDKLNEESDHELTVLQDKLNELHDKYLRLAAEYDNYRKRTAREKADLIQTAGETLLKDILPIVDDFERGLELASNAEDMEAMRTGMELIYNKLKDFLTNNGIREINAINEPFDTDWHEAVTNIPAPSDDMKGLIVDVIQKGYTLNNKVIRFPKVVIGE